MILLRYSYFLLLTSSIYLAVLNFKESLAFDQSGKNAAGFTGGRVIPSGNNQFDKEAEDGWMIGALFRRHLDAKKGFDVTISRYYYEKICSCTHSTVFDVLGFYRLWAADNVSPIIGAGLGLADNAQHEAIHFGTRFRLGFEKALSPKLALGAYFDYQRITKMFGANESPRPSNIYSLSPKLELTWTFEN